jgi:hypothetical protein
MLEAPPIDRLGSFRSHFIALRPYILQCVVTPARIDAYLDQGAPTKRFPILPCAFAIGGNGVMLLGAFGAQQSATSSQLMMLGGSACEAIGIAWLAPAAVRKIFSS